jgi:hypothetical protein
MSPTVAASMQRPFRVHGPTQTVQIERDLGPNWSCRWRCPYLVQVIRQLEGIACTLLGSPGSGRSILWLMDLVINTFLTTQGLGHHWLGSFQHWLMQYNRYRNSPQFLKVHLLPDDLLQSLSATFSFW